MNLNAIELFLFYKITFLLIISHGVNKYTFDLKGVFAKNEMVYRLTAKKKRF